MFRTTISTVAVLVFALSATPASALISAAGKFLPIATAKTLKITEIEVVARHKSVPPEVVAKSKEQLDLKTAKCATGTVPAKISIRLDNHKGTDGGATIMIGDYVQFAELVTIKSENDEVIGEYYIEEFRFGGGLFGLAILSSKESLFPNDFARTLCAGVFGVELPDDTPPPEEPDQGS